MPTATCPVCQSACDSYEVSFSKEGTWCNHAGWVLRTGLTRDDPPILGGLVDYLNGRVEVAP